MKSHELVQGDIGPVEGGFASPALDVRMSSPLLAVQPEAWAAALARAQEDAAMEAQDALSQANEALVMG